MLNARFILGLFSSWMFFGYIVAGCRILSTHSHTAVRSLAQLRVYIIALAYSLFHQQLQTQCVLTYMSLFIDKHSVRKSFLDPVEENTKTIENNQQKKMK